MHLRSLLPEFKHFLLMEENKSPSTWEVYGTFYRHLLAWSCEVRGKEIETSEMVTPVLRSYTSHRIGEGVRANTINQEIAALNTLCKWLLERGDISSLPVWKRQRPEAQSRIVPTDEEVYALLDACERFASSARRALAGLIVRTLIHTGVRRFELLALTLEDFSVERGTVHVRKGKGGKERKLPICEELADAHRKYLALRPQGDSERLFVVGTLPVETDRITSLFRELRAMSRQHDKEYLQPHALRHWFACNCYRNMLNADPPERDPLRKLQRLLGHKSIVTTERYLIGLGVDVESCAAYTGTQRASQKPVETARKHRVVVNRKRWRRW